jgi:anaerobic ribonucleoside-triphosphate reductase activating protein
MRGMSSAGTLRVGARVPVTRVEGPGARYALWVQGCSIRCPGCCNPHLFDAAGGTVVTIDVLLAEIRAARPAIEGVTFLGGEPFEQAAALARVAAGAQALGLSVMVFSGYALEELRARAESGVASLLQATDVLVDGRYEATRPERGRLWAGSENQRFHYLTDRYSREIELPPPGAPLREVEVRIEADGRIAANGWPTWRGSVQGRAVALEHFVP